MVEKSNAEELAKMIFDAIEMIVQESKCTEFTAYQEVKKIYKSNNKSLKLQLIQKTKKWIERKYVEKILVSKIPEKVENFLRDHGLVDKYINASLEQRQALEEYVLSK